MDVLFTALLLLIIGFALGLWKLHVAACQKAFHDGRAAEAANRDEIVQCSIRRVIQNGARNALRPDLTCLIISVPRTYVADAEQFPLVPISVGQPGYVPFHVHKDVHLQLVSHALAPTRSLTSRELN